MSYATVGTRAVAKAGGYLLKHFHRIRKQDIRLKGAHDVVTKADLQANRIIIREIKKVFPNHDVLSEETGLQDHPGTFRWVVDPLDGTTNYTIGNPLFCTVLALLHGPNILFSAIYAPFLNEFYTAEVSKGARLNGKKIHVSSVRKLDRAILTYGFSHQEKSHRKGYQRAQSIRKFVLNTRVFAYVAAGRVEGCFLAPETIPWDTAAGTLLVREAGGTVTDFAGRPWTLKSRSIAASNGRIHDKLIRHLAP